jgi:hypothetical protein
MPISYSASPESNSAYLEAKLWPTLLPVLKELVQRVEQEVGGKDIDLEGGGVNWLAEVNLHRTAEFKMTNTVIAIVQKKSKQEMSN